MQGFDDERDDDFDNDFTIGAGPPPQYDQQLHYDEEEPVEDNDEQEDEANATRNEEDQDNEDNEGSEEESNLHDTQKGEHSDMDQTKESFTGLQDGDISMTMDNKRLDALGMTQDSEVEQISEDGEEPEIMSVFPSENEFQQLQLSPEMHSMFSTIFQFQVQTLALPTPLQPFMPKFEPAIGDPDNFTKVQRPDSGKDLIGLVVLDEPGPVQSNPSILEMQLRNATTLSKGKAPAHVRTVDPNEKGALGLQSWIQSIEEFHRSKPSPSVSYKGPMPSIETLMQIWPSSFESSLRQLPLPRISDLDIPLREYIPIVCSLLDIPVHEDDLSKSLHVLFTLFHEFRQNPHFRLLQVNDVFPSAQNSSAGLSSTLSSSTTPSSASSPGSASASASSSSSSSSSASGKLNLSGLRQSSTPSPTQPGSRVRA